MIAGPSEGPGTRRQDNAGEELTWEDVNSANWSVANSSSPAGYIYPSLWLQENFGKNITDLPTPSSPTPTAAPSLALPQARLTSYAPTPTPAATMRTSGPPSTP